MCYISRPSHSSRWSLYVGCGVQIIKFLVMYFFPFPVTLSLLGRNILLRTLFSCTLCLCSSMWVTKFYTRTKPQAKL
jgi:hypothetical protein